VKSEFYEKVNREFWTFLRSQGFPEGIDDRAIQRRAVHVEQIAMYKLIRLTDWRWVEVYGAQHSDDVALVSLLAESLGLEQGRDWDWGVESDEYHMYIAFSGRSKVRRLQQLVDLFNRAELIRLEVFSQIAPSKAKEISDETLQRLLHEAWKRVEEDRKKQMEELKKILGEALGD